MRSDCSSPLSLTLLVVPLGGPDMTLQEINAAAEVIYANVDSDANIIFGALVDDKLTHGEVSTDRSIESSCTAPCLYPHPNLHLFIAICVFYVCVCTIHVM